MARTPGSIGKLEDSWSGPWKVLDRCGPVNYTIRSPDCRGKGWVVHLNSIK